MRELRKVAVVLLCVVVAGVTACGSGNTGPSAGEVTIFLSDAPVSGVDSATVWISNVYLIGGSDSSGSRYTISNSMRAFNLLNLQSGVTAALGTSSIPVGDYSQLRLVVDSARIVLDSGLTFADGSATKAVKVPSGTQSGIKVDFGGSVHVAPGQTILVVDFDVSRNFVFTGPPSAPTGVLFTPLLHATVQNVAGSIAGTASPAAAKGRLFAILSTTSGPDTVTTALADSITGAYKLWYLPPGSYTVADTAAGYVAAKQTVTVGPGQNITGVNFTLTK